MIDHLAVIGVGLIGGSLVRALRRAGAVRRVTGFARRESSLQRARELGVIDAAADDPASAVKDADMVVVATPLASVETLMRAVLPGLRADAVITDVGSAKGSVVAAARAALGPHLPRFVPGHPIAGTEQSGVEASFAELFDDHLVILTPVGETDPAATERVTRMWETARARVVTLAVEHHDKVLAATSHLPHMLAYALVDCLASMQDREEIFEFAAGGFADFTRIASSNPEMWHDVCFANRTPLLDALGELEHHLKNIRGAVEAGDGEALLAIFRRAKAARDRFVSARERNTGERPGNA